MLNGAVSWCAFQSMLNGAVRLVRVPNHSKIVYNNNNICVYSFSLPLYFSVLLFLVPSLYPLPLFAIPHRLLFNKKKATIITKTKKNKKRGVQCGNSDSGIANGKRVNSNRRNTASAEVQEFLQE